MLDDDIIKSTVLMSCGCLLSHNHYFKSGIEHDTAIEHIKNRYNYDMDNNTITDYHADFNKLQKLMISINVERLCYMHTQELMSNIIFNTKQYYNNNNKNKKRKHKK